MHDGSGEVTIDYQGTKRKDILGLLTKSTDFAA